MKQYHAQHMKVTAQPGQRDALIQQLDASIGMLKRTPGCIYYLISTTDEPDAVCVSELWASKEAKDAVAKDPESAKVMSQLAPLIAAMGERTTMTVVGGVGIE